MKFLRNLFRKKNSNIELPNSVEKSTMALFSENCMGYSLHCPHCIAQYAQTPNFWVEICGNNEQRICHSCQQSFLGPRGWIENKKDAA